MFQKKTFDDFETRHETEAVTTHHQDDRLDTEDGLL
jgi:hypothetical protein